MANLEQRAGANPVMGPRAWLRLCVVVLMAVLCGSASDAEAADPRASPETRSQGTAPVTAEGIVEEVRVRLTIWRSRGEKPLAGWEEERPVRFGARVDGHASYVLDHAVPEGERRVLRLLDFARAADREPRELDALTFAAYQGGPWSRGGTRVLEAVDQRGNPLESLRIADGDEIEISLPSGVEVVYLRYRVSVPRRYWPLGCVRNRCSLSGGLAPLPSEKASGGVYLPEEGRVVRPVRWEVESVRFGDVPDWKPGTDSSPAQAELLAGDEIVVSERNAMRSQRHAYPSVFWGRRWRRHSFVYQGVDVQILHMDRRPAARYPNETLLQYRADVAGHVDAIAREALDTAYRLGIQPPPDSTLTIIQGPIRSDIAQNHPTVLTVSDEYLNVLPAARFRRFHEVQVARTILDHLSLAYFTPHQGASERLWVAGAVGFALTQVWQARRDLPDEDARDLLRNQK